MKKTLCTVIAALSVCALMLVSCGDMTKSSDKKGGGEQPKVIAVYKQTNGDATYTFYDNKTVVRKFMGMVKNGTYPGGELKDGQLTIMENGKALVVTVKNNGQIIERSVVMGPPSTPPTTFTYKKQ